MSYVDGFVIALPKKNVPACRRMSKAAAKVWKEYGAVEYRERVGDDLDTKMGMPFPRMAKLKKNETAVFSWILYKSKAQRNAVNKKVMKDPRIQKMMTQRPLFDDKRMAYAGFKVIVDM